MAKWPMALTPFQVFQDFLLVIAWGLFRLLARAAKQLPIDLDWYTKFEARANELYQNMLTE